MGHFVRLCLGEAAGEVRIPLEQQRPGYLIGRVWLGGAGMHVEGVRVTEREDGQYDPWSDADTPESDLLDNVGTLDAMNEWPSEGKYEASLVVDENGRQLEGEWIFFLTPFS